MKSIYYFLCLTAPTFGAVSFSLPGKSESAAWTLTSTVHPGFNTFGTAANAWASGISPDAGVADAVLHKIAGSGYIGGSFLYTAGLSGTFSITDSFAIASLATVVFQGKISDPFDGIALNYNGGSQTLPPDFRLVLAGNGYPDRAWQWDLSAIAGVTSYEIIYSGHHAANSLSVATGDSFLQVIPEPSMTLLGAAALASTLTRRRRA